MKKQDQPPEPLERLYEGAVRGRRWRQLRERLQDYGDLVAAPVESLFGGKLQSDGSPVIETPELTLEAITALFQHRACGVHVPGFCPPELAEHLAQWIVQQSGVSNWRVLDETGKLVPSDMDYGVGMPVSLGFSTKENFVKYFAEALPSIRRLRAASQQLSPIDRLRLELDEIWPAGARVKSYMGKKGFVGIGRVMTPGTLFDGAARDEGICHVDGVPLLRPNAGVFSVNVYLRVPERGGELNIWNIPQDRWTVRRNRSVFRDLRQNCDEDAAARTRKQQRLRSTFPPPLTIKPAVGDLVMICSQRPHAVRGFPEGSRVTIQCFIEHLAGRPLTLSS